MIHCFLENQSDTVKAVAKAGKLAGPEFVGQGCTQRVGSDSYGYYVAEILKPGRLVALVRAEDEFVNGWAAGDMTCSMPTDVMVKQAAIGGNAASKYFDYVEKYGKKWYWCDVDPYGKIIRRRGNHAWLSWNGAFSYRDPSF